MENERKYQEERKGLTLADVGVPDYTEEQWHKLTPREKLKASFEINRYDYPLGLDNPLTYRQTWINECLDAVVLAPLSVEFLKEKRVITRPIKTFREEQIAVYDAGAIIYLSSISPDLCSSKSKIRTHEKARAVIDSLRERLTCLYEHKASLNWEDILTVAEEVGKNKKSVNRVVERSINVFEGPYFTNNFIMHFNPKFEHGGKDSSECLSLKSLLDENPLVFPTDFGFYTGGTWDEKQRLFPYYVLLRRGGFTRFDLCA